MGRRQRVSVLGAGVLLCFGALVHGTGAREHQSTSAQAARGVIAGQVVDAGSGRPLPGVPVMLGSVGRIEAEIDTAGRVIILPTPAQTSDADGRFAFESLRAGGYRISATLPRGFVPGSAFVHLRVDERITDVTLRLAPYGSINGTVRDEAGDPVVGMRVQAHQRRTAGFRTMLIPRGTARVDDRGQFRIADLPPGDYLVCACDRDPLTIDKALLPLLGAPASAAATLAQRLDASVPTFAPTFPPSTTRAADATFIGVGYPSEEPRIDITVHSVVPRRVLGRLIGIGGSDLTRWTVLLIPENERPETQAISAINTVRFTAAGVFEFVAVPPGRYALEAFKAEGTQDRWGSLAVEVGDEDISGLVVPMTEGTPVTGRFEFSGFTARPDGAALGKSRVSLVPADLTFRALIGTGSSGSVGLGTATSPDGTFRIERVPPGRYMVSASGLGPDWQTIGSVRSGANAVVDRIVTVGALGLSDVIISMTDALSAELSGNVALQKYESPASLRAVLFPVEPATWSAPMGHPERFQLAQITEGNTFRFASVPAGDYFVATTPADTYLGLEQLEQYSRSATRVSLREGQTTRVEVRR